MRRRLFPVLLATLVFSACKGSDPAPAPTGGAWGPTSTLQASSADRATELEIANGTNGTVVAMWEHQASLGGGSFGPSSLRTSLYTPGSGWSAATTFASGSVPQLAANAGGQVVVGWNQADTAMVSLYTPGSGWNTATPASASGLLQGRVHVGIDDAGNVIAAWRQSTGAYVNRYTAGSWGTPQQLAPDHANPVGVAMNGSGTAVVLWAGIDTVALTPEVRAVRFTPAGGWEAGALLGTGFTQRAVMDAAGNATVVWAYNISGSPSVIQASRLLANDGAWSAPADLQADSSVINVSPIPGVDAAGNVFVVWQCIDGASSKIKSRRFEPASGWSSVYTFNANSAASDGYAMVRVAADGSALALWHSSSPAGGTLRSSRYLPGSGWLTPVTAATPYAQNIEMTVDAGGVGTLLWQDVDGANTGLLARQFIPQ